MERSAVHGWVCVQQERLSSWDPMFSKEKAIFCDRTNMRLHDLVRSSRKIHVASLLSSLRYITAK